MRLNNIGWIINPGDLTPELIDRLAGCGINELGIHPGGGKRAPQVLEETLAFHALKSTQALYARARDRGITVEYDAHVLSWLLPREEFERHPDWFRMDESGARTPDINMCASSEEALDYVSRRAMLLAERLHTPSHRYAYWIDDVKNGACCCPRCRGLSAADQALKITNAMYRGAKQADGEAVMGFLAYQDTLALPETVKPEKGIYLEYAPIDRDSARPIDDVACAANVSQTANLKKLLSFFGSENARVLEYWVDNSRFSDWKRPPKPMALNEDVMQKDVRFYASLGFRDMTSFACFLGPDYIGLYGQPPIERYAGILKEIG